MDELLDSLRLSRDARKVLARLGRADAGPSVLCGQDERLCEQALRQVVDPVLQDAGPPCYSRIRTKRSRPSSGPSSKMM